MRYKHQHNYESDRERVSFQESKVSLSRTEKVLHIVMPVIAVIFVALTLTVAIHKSHQKNTPRLSPFNMPPEDIEYRLVEDVTPKDNSRNVKTPPQAHIDKNKQSPVPVKETGNSDKKDKKDDSENLPADQKDGVSSALTRQDGENDTQSDEDQSEEVRASTQPEAPQAQEAGNPLDTPINPQEENKEDAKTDDAPVYAVINLPGNSGDTVIKDNEADSSDDAEGAELYRSEYRALPLSAAQGLENQFEPSWKNVFVYVELANIREDASLDAEVLTQVIKGEELTEIETNGEWSRVKLTDGLEGYIFSNLISYEYVEPSEEPPEMVYSAEKLEEIQKPCDLTLYANASVVRIREQPSLNGEIITDMYYGDWVRAVSYGYDWYKIELKDGKFGYVHGKFLQEEPVEIVDLLNDEAHQQEVIAEGVAPSEEYIQDTPKTTASVGAVGLVDLAMQYVGYPYVYGAAGPNAFDCSGFVQYLHAQMGVSIGRTTYQQVHDGIDVPYAPGDYSHMLPGDIILLASGSDVYHSMLYIGGGQVIHAGTPATGVNVDNLDYYAAHVAFVKRVFY